MMAVVEVHSQPVVAPSVATEAGSLCRDEARGHRHLAGHDDNTTSQRRSTCGGSSEGSGLGAKSTNVGWLGDLVRVVRVVGVGWHGVWCPKAGVWGIPAVWVLV